MTDLFYSERKNGVPTRITEDINPKAWRGIVSLIEDRIENGAFGFKYPLLCQDGHGFYGCDTRKLQTAIEAVLPDVIWPLNSEAIPEIDRIFDILEFLASAVGKPIEGHFHSYHRHHHLSWDRDLGLQEFAGDVNRIFLSNRLAFQMRPDGQIGRILSEKFGETVARFTYSIGESETDTLINFAITKIRSPRAQDRQDALEKLWDAFERIKTLSDGKDKKEKVTALLDRCAFPGSKMRQLLEIEAKQLTEIGNTLQIRHSETDKEKLSKASHVDYLFWRLLSFFELVINAQQT